MKNRIVELLESVRRRPLLYIGQMNSELMESFLAGFDLACFALIDFERFVGKRIEARRDVIAERGWEVTAMGPTKEMKARGMSDEAIIDEQLAIEIETWKRLLADTRTSTVDS